MEQNDDIKNLISTRQKGFITENRASEIITLSSGGRLTCYTPNTDDDGVDLIVNPRGIFKPLFVQVKSRFKLQRSGQFIQNVGASTFRTDKLFHILFMYFDKEALEVEKLWLIPSTDFKHIAYLKKAGDTYKSFYRFSANPKSQGDRWAKFTVDKREIGEKLLRIISSINYGSEDIKKKFVVANKIGKQLEAIKF